MFLIIMASINVASHRHQTTDPLLRRWVRQPCHTVSRQRLYNEHVGLGIRDLKRYATVGTDRSERYLAAEKKGKQVHHPPDQEGRQQGLLPAYRVTNDKAQSHKPGHQNRRLEIVPKHHHGKLSKHAEQSRHHERLTQYGSQGFNLENR